MLTFICFHWESILHESFRPQVSITWYIYEESVALPCVPRLSGSKSVWMTYDDILQIWETINGHNTIIHEKEALLKGMHHSSKPQICANIAFPLLNVKLQSNNHMGISGNSAENICLNVQSSSGCITAPATSYKDTVLSFKVFPSSGHCIWKKTLQSLTKHKREDNQDQCSL